MLFCRELTKEDKTARRLVVSKRKLVIVFQVKSEQLLRKLETETGLVSCQLKLLREIQLRLSCWCKVLEEDYE